MLKLYTVLFLLSSLIHPINIIADLSGTVKDGDGNAISGALVNLSSNTSNKVTTDTKGGFVLKSSVSVESNQNSIRYKQQAISISIVGTRLQFITSTDIAKGTFSLFSGDGKMWFDLQFNSLKNGVHTFTIPLLPTGCYIIKIKTDKGTMQQKLLFSCNKSFFSHTSIIKEINSNSINRVATTSSIDTILVTKDGFKPEKYSISTYNQTGLIIYMDRTSSPTLTVKDLPIIKEMPDPLTMKDGTKVTTPEQWKLRRREMIRILEDYEYGHMPLPPGNVKATVKTPLTRVTTSGKQADYRMLQLTFGPREKCSFDLGIFTPITPPEGKGHPILIYLGYSSPTKSSLGDASAALGRGYAVAIINYTQLGADATSWKSSAFFPSYPEYDWRDFSAWAWGISRAVDYLVTDSLIDNSKIMTTGVSRCGQPVLLAGALDERIALSAPVAGGMALRFSGKEMGGGLGQGITEVVDQGTYWFGPLLPQFKNQTPRLPCDQHWLPALTAPRHFIMCNSLSDEYGRAYAAVQTYLGAKPVYEFLKAPENIGLNFRAGSHGMLAEDWSALLDFADQKLLKKAGTRRFDEIPPSSKLP
jgi:hypothetical protein